MNKTRISRQQILNNIPEQYRHYFNIVILDITQDIYPLFKNFTDAVNILCKHAQINKKVDIFFTPSKSNGIVSSDYLTLQYQIHPEAVHVYYNGCIFYDLAKANLYPREIQIASFLEELVHTYMNISDEILVKKVVAWMYEGIHYNENTEQYEPIYSKDK